MNYYWVFCVIKKEKILLRYKIKVKYYWVFCVIKNIDIYFLRYNIKVKYFVLAKSKLNSIETLISQAWIDIDISHEEFVTILKEKDKYEKKKENLRNENEEYKIMRLSSIKSKI